MPNLYKGKESILKLYIKKHLNKTKKTIKRHHILVENIWYLTVLQVFTLIVPVITFPYLIRVLGKETYGLVVFAQAVISYLVILVSFGFNYSATKEVSIHREDKDKLSEIFSSVFFIKVFLLLIAFIVLAIMLFIIPEAKGYNVLFFLCMWACLYDVIFPIWFFRGIENMKFITYINILSRLIFLVLIFVFIHSTEDYLFVPIINGIGAIISGIISFVIVYKEGVQIKMQSLAKLKFYFKDAIPLFFSNLSVQIYVSANKVIVGGVLGMVEVAYYDLAEKLLNLLKIPVRLIGQSVYPKISKEKNISFINKMMWRVFALMIFLYIIMYFSVSPMVVFLGGVDMLPTVNVARIMFLSVPLIALNGYLGPYRLIPFGHNVAYLKIVIITTLIYGFFVSLVYFIFNLSLVSIAFSLVLTETFIAILGYFYCRKYNILK